MLGMMLSTFLCVISFNSHFPSINLFNSPTLSVDLSIALIFKNEKAEVYQD